MTRVYVRDSLAARDAHWPAASKGSRGLLPDMTADDKTERGTSFAHTDQVGKVFIVVAQRVRRCAICEQLFTRRAAAEHSTVPCMPNSQK